MLFIRMIRQNVLLILVKLKLKINKPKKLKHILCLIFYHDL